MGCPKLLEAFHRSLPLRSFPEVVRSRFMSQVSAGKCSLLSSLIVVSPLGLVVAFVLSPEGCHRSLP